jgi:hypothetical protein
LLAFKGNLIMTIRKTLIAAATSAAMALAATSAIADLVFLGPVTLGGTGHGTVATVLTFASPGSTSFEAASVGLAPGGAQVITGDAQLGSLTQVVSFSSLGVTNASDLRIVFNAVEPSADSIVINSLIANVFSPTGALLFSTSYTNTPHTILDSFVGTGNSGFAFALDAASAASLQTVLDLPGSGNNVLGIASSASLATGGPETIFAVTAMSPIPEPESYAMMLAGLGLMGFMARRKSKKLS